MRENYQTYNQPKGEEGKIKFQLYQVSTNEEPSIANEMVNITSSEETKEGLLIELETIELNKIIKVILRLNINIKEQTIQPSLKLYNISTIEYPSILPEEYQTIEILEDLVEIDLRPQINYRTNKYYILITTNGSNVIAYTPSQLEVKEVTELIIPKYTINENMTLEEANISVDIYTGHINTIQPDNVC